MNQEMVTTFIRAALKFGGGYLVAKGIVDEGGVETVIGAIVAVIGVVWGVVAAKQAAKNNPATK